MRITELQIDHFGVWRDLALPLNENGLTVLYGPNEAGKSTLLEFVRGVLFGYSAGAQDKLSPHDRGSGGTVWVSSEGTLQAVSRRIENGVPQLEIVENGLVADPASRLDELRHGVSSNLWDGVFCLGLEDFQHLGVLEADRVAEYIYQATLGPDGQRILSAVAHFRHEFAGQNRSHIEQEIELLVHRRREIADRLVTFDSRRPHELNREAAEVGERLKTRERELADGRLRLRRLILRERAWTPLQKIREVRAELATLPDAPSFPLTGMARLSRLDRKARQLATAGRGLVARLRELEAENSSSGLTSEQAGMLRGLVAQRPLLEEVARQIDQTRRKEAALRREVTEAQRAFGSDWSDDALRQLDVSDEASRALELAGANFDVARRRHSHLRRTRQRLEARYSELHETVSAGLKAVPGGTVETALNSARSRLDAIPRVTELKAREALLVRRLEEIQRHPRIAPPHSLPPWLSAVLAVFFFVGILLAGWGFLAGATDSAVSGLLYGLLGLTFAGLAWGLKTQHEQDRFQLSGHESSVRSAVQRELEQVQLDLRQLAQSAPAALTASNEARAAAAEVSRLADLAHNERELQLLAQRRRRLRRRLAQARDLVRSSHQEWLTKLQQLGLSGTSSPSTALPGWRSLTAIAGKLATLDQAATAIESLERLNQTLRTGAEELQSQLPNLTQPGESPVAQFEQWKQELADWNTLRQRRRERRDEVRSIRRSLRRLRRRLDAVTRERRTLWLQAGARDRSEFSRRAAALNRQLELRRRLSELEVDITRLKAEFPEMIGHLDEFEIDDSPAGPLDLEDQQQQTNRLEREIEEDRTRLTEIARELDALASETTVPDLRLEAERLEQDLRRTVQCWAAQQLAGQTLTVQAAEFERRHQPETLNAASLIFARLTAGRYRRVWTPLTEQRLLVEDETGVSRPVETLSRGTREQLYLAVRLAVVECLAHQGVVLPMLLDDVFVNFDQTRSVAAVAELIDFAERGHQVLFLTCHLHLAQMFKHRGIEPTWLNTSQGSERLAS